MGDGGALLLGLLMAASTMLVGGRTHRRSPVSGQTYFFFAPLFIPLFILGVPIVDTAFAIVRRARHAHGRRHRRQGPPAPPAHAARPRPPAQRAHPVGAGRALLSAFVLYPTYTGKGDAIVPIGIAALGLLLYTLFHPGRRQAREAEREGEATDAAPEPVEGLPSSDQGLPTQVP